MRGFYAPGASDYGAGAAHGRADGTRLGFAVTIRTESVPATIADPNRRMWVEGTITAKELGPVPMPISDGTFDLFTAGHNGRFAMRYRLPFTTVDGRPMTLLGHKDVGDDRGPDMWPDTTTLFIRLIDGTVDWSDEAGPEHARGILTLTAPMFAGQLLTFRGGPAALARFGWFFCRHLLIAYRGPYPERNR